MSRRTGLLALAVAGALLYRAAPVSGADEPVATAPIPPAVTQPPAQHPLHVSPNPAKAGPGTAKPAKPAVKNHERKSAERHKPAVHDAGGTSKRAERGQSHRPAPEPRPEHRHAAASRDQLRPPPPDYRPRRYYREEIEGPPFPPPWYERGPPFAAMPFPREPMPPW